MRAGEDPRAQRELERAIEWRATLLRQAGMPPDSARAVASDTRYDLHAVLDLLERGCPPALALDIAAPLEDRRMP